jgi:hypothetical protein
MRNRMSTHTKALAAVAAAFALLALWAPGDAAANSRLTVANQSSGNLTINIFNGNDLTCLAPDKQKTLKPGASDGMGCEGNGTRRCLVELRWETDAAPSTGRACSGDLYQKCGTRRAIHVANRATVTVEPDGTCTIVNP